MGIRPAKKTRVLSICLRRGSNIRRLCLFRSSQCPRRWYSRIGCNIEAIKRLSCRELTRCRPRFEHSACLEEVQSAGLSAIPMATGSGSEMPLCPVCVKNACAAVLLERMANSAMGLFSASTRSMLAVKNGTSATQLPAYHFQRAAQIGRRCARLRDPPKC